ncbi:hypothetical protein OK016_01685 [Vibrio chagasii]|nr:hypothetical protein [Vibrio chagasii]
MDKNLFQSRSSSPRLSVHSKFQIISGYRSPATQTKRITI